MAREFFMVAGPELTRSSRTPRPYLVIDGDEVAPDRHRRGSRLPETVRLIRAAGADPAADEAGYCHSRPHRPYRRPAAWVRDYSPAVVAHETRAAIIEKRRTAGLRPPIGNGLPPDYRSRFTIACGARQPPGPWRNSELTLPSYARTYSRPMAVGWIAAGLRYISARLFTARSTPLSARTSRLAPLHERPAGLRPDVLAEGHYGVFPWRGKSRLVHRGFLDSTPE
jgi:hypothetical protein